MVFEVDDMKSSIEQPYPYRKLEEPLPHHQHSDYARNTSQTKFPRRISSYLAIAQMLFGMVAIITDMVHMMAVRDDALMMGQGIFCGVLFVVAGSLVKLSAKKQTRCVIVGCMVMCIIAAVFTLSLLYIGGKMLGFALNVNCSEISGPNCETLVKHGAAVGAMLLVTSVSEAIASIWSASLCCACICCGANYAPVTVIYYTGVAPHGSHTEGAHVVVPGTIRQLDETELDHHTVK